MDDIEEAIIAGALQAVRRRAARQAQIAADGTTIGARGAIIRSGEAAIALRLAAALDSLGVEMQREMADG